MVSDGGCGRIGPPGLSRWYGPRPLRESASQVWPSALLAGSVRPITIAWEGDVGNRSRAALVAGGVFLVGVAALSRFYAYPTLAVAPADQVTQVIADGPGARIFDVATLKEITIDLQAVRNIRGDVAASGQASKDLDRDVVVYDMSIVTDKPGYVLPDDAKQTDNWPRSFSQQRMVLDARTGEAVSWKPQDPKRASTCPPRSRTPTTPATTPTTRALKTAARSSRVTRVWC